MNLNTAENTVTALPARQRWQQAWREAVRDPRELLSMLGLNTAALRISGEAAQQFPLRVPRGFIAMQVEGYGLDAVGDAAANIGQGVLHKYHGRALLIATGSCAIHCRYCFRRHFPYSEAAIETIRKDQSLTEIILSGGDPLSLSTSKLAELTTALRRIPHIKRLRLHTRLPVVLPERIDAEFLDWLDDLPWTKAVVIHANHANEFDSDVDNALLALRNAGAHLLNQAILLRGVNDNTNTLQQLCERGFEAGVLPYYLHQLDRVNGAAHFEVSDAHAQSLHAQLLATLPGYLVPKLVREVAGGASKWPLQILTDG